MREIEYRPRRWWIAALFLLAPPAGLLYVGSALGFVIVFVIAALTHVIIYIGTIGWFATPFGILSLAMVGALSLIYVVAGTIWMAVRHKAYLLKWYNRAWVYALAVGASLALSIGPGLLGATQKIETYTHPSTSMIPTIRVGDYLVADQRPSAIAAVTAGDVVVARYADRNNLPYVHRVIGMPGDNVRLVNGVPEINGILLKQEPVGSGAGDGIDDPRTGIVRREFLPSGRSYLITVRPDLAARRNTEIVTIGADEFFILGDNREIAIDSTLPRPNGFGLLRRSEISGVVTGFYWSSDFNRVGQRIDAPDLQ